MPDTPAGEKQLEKQPSPPSNRKIIYHPCSFYNPNTFIDRDNNREHAGHAYGSVCGQSLSDIGGDY